MPTYFCGGCYMPVVLGIHSFAVDDAGTLRHRACKSVEASTPCRCGHDKAAHPIRSYATPEGYAVTIATCVVARCSCSVFVAEKTAVA